MESEHIAVKVKPKLQEGISVSILKKESKIKCRSKAFKPDDFDSSESDIEPPSADPTIKIEIPEVLRKQGTVGNCSGNVDNECPCNTLEAVERISKQISFSDRRNRISVDRLNELRKKAQDAIKNHRTFTIRGCFFSVRNALAARGWVEKLDVHRKHGSMGSYQVSYEDLAQNLPKRRPGESKRQYLIKCERNIMSRFLEHVPIDFLWTARKEKCDWIDQAKNPSMIINKFHRAPFTSKEGLCSQLHDFHWYFEEGLSEMYFPRCYNVWSPEELAEFIENFRMTACISFLKFIVENYRNLTWDAVFSHSGKIPYMAIDFALKRCQDFVDFSNHNDIDSEEQIRIWEHDWDAFLTNHYLLTHEQCRIQVDQRKCLDSVIRNAERVLEGIKACWPQYHLDGYLNIWIVKPANKCRGRGILLMNNIKKIQSLVNPPIATKSRYVVQKYLERPLIIHNTKFDIRQWFLVTSVQPLTIWMYKESYLRFSSQEYNLLNYHESVHLTNHAVQKKYCNGKRDDRLPTENMWDCYTFQAYLRQIGQYEMWSERIYPGMQRAINGTMLASQDNMDRRVNNFELFGADFMISEDFYPFLIEINSSPDLGATTSVTARMCPQCLEDSIKVVIDRRLDVNADTGNFEMIYRQSIPPVPAYMGLNLFLKGRQIMQKANTTLRRERSVASMCHFRATTTLPTSQSHSNLLPMPTYKPSFILDDQRSPVRKSPIAITDLLDNLLPMDTKRSVSDGNYSQPINNKSSFHSGRNGMLLRCATSPLIKNAGMLLASSASFLRPHTQNSLNSVIPSFLCKNRDERLTNSINAKLHPYSKRYFSCGPRIITKDLSEKGSAQPKDEKAKNSYQNHSDLTNMDTAGEKTTLSEKDSPGSVRNVTSTLQYQSKSAKSQRFLAMSSSRRKISNAGQIRRSVSSRNLSNSNICGNDAEKNAKFKLTENASAPKSSQSAVSSFYAVGMGLKTWRARQQKAKRVLNQTTGTSANNINRKNRNYRQ